MYPRIVVDLKKIENNTKSIVEMTKKQGVDVAAVTKVFCGNPNIAQAYIDGGARFLADARIENLEKLSHMDIPKMMLRLPMISEVEKVVMYSDISLNSEYETVKALSKAAEDLGKVHGIILMVDLGDLREGYFKEEDLMDDVKKILELDGVKLLGLGTNMACYGGIIPEEKSIKRLEELQDKIETEFKIDLEMLSGGNSATIHLLKDEKIGAATNLRLGETLILGKEPSYDEQLPGTVNDAFSLEVEVIEIKEKPSLPEGKVGKDAFGKIPTFEDHGIRKRIICAVGKQDIDHDTMFPYDEKLSIFGGSSDHLILDGTDSETDYKVGDIIKFRLAYVSILRAMTSEYVKKTFVK